MSQSFTQTLNQGKLIPPAYLILMASSHPCTNTNLFLRSVEVSTPACHLEDAFAGNPGSNPGVGVLFALIYVTAANLDQ